MRTETGVSSGTTASSDWAESIENKTQIEVAKTIVKTAVAGAVNTIHQVRNIFYDKKNFFLEIWGMIDLARSILINNYGGNKVKPHIVFPLIIAPGAQTFFE